ncbi:hypothetical protein [Sphingomonas sp. HMP6]|uniref:hypothetical protein n=1 Tax=Sphingomonas sp. HMP6 TaxID=1517551 RepID=UPI001596A7C2|nr:hypothetical protein [Sphingomonas sp. HMP6]BCA60686.1 hypothetical protein HMP06_3455 [Sphingomonas sp. HMP6]
MFVLADAAHGAQRHHKDNAVLVSSYSEALELVHRGYPIRMSDGRSPASLVSPASLQFVDAPVDHFDDLWTYTMPAPPFTLQAMMEDLREHLVSQAADLERIAGIAAATAFLGFEVEDFSDYNHKKIGEKLNLDAFNITRIARRAYESAFRPWPCEALDLDEADELEQILRGSMVRFSRRYGSPLDREGSSLNRTVLAAYNRWRIADGCFYVDDNVELGTTEAIGALTGMPVTAVRNAMSRDGLSLVKSKIDNDALLDWITSRRNFAPLRQSETSSEIWAWVMIHEFKSHPLDEALANIRSRATKPSPDLDAAEQVIIARRAARQLPSWAELRRYAAALRAAPDRLILNLTDIWSPD